RLVTDSISDWFFCTEPAGVDNLLAEGKPKAAVFHVGHVMVDNLLFQRERLGGTDSGSFPSAALKAELGRYGIVTLHRPSNVDEPEVLAGIVDALNTISADLPLVFPVHPRTRANLERFGITPGPRIRLIGP